MNKEFIWAVVKRFGRAFLVGGLAQAVVIVSTQANSIKDWADLGRWAVIIVVGFISGGLLALDKLARFDSSKQ